MLYALKPTYNLKKYGFAVGILNQNKLYLNSISRIVFIVVKLPFTLFLNLYNVLTTKEVKILIPLWNISLTLQK